MKGKKDFQDVIFVHEGRASNFDAHNFVRSVLSLHSGRICLAH